MTLLEFLRITSLGWEAPPPARNPSRRVEIGPGVTWRSCSSRKGASKPALAIVQEILRSAYAPDESGRRPVPAAGALYGCSFDVVDLEMGDAMHLGATSEVVRASTWPREDVSAAFYHQITGPAWIVVVSMDMDRYSDRYGSRGIRYALFEAGHVMQEVLRAAERLDVRTCPLGAFDDNGVAALLGSDLIEINWKPLYAVALTCSAHNGRDSE